MLCPGEGWPVDAVAAQPGQVLLGGGGAQHQDVPHHPDQEEAGGLQGGVSSERRGYIEFSLFANIILLY